jgi:hypothetical protein
MMKCTLLSGSTLQLRTVMETLAKQYKAKDEQVVKLQADAKR